MTKREKVIITISIFVILIITLLNFLLVNFAIREVVTLQKISLYTVNETEELKKAVLIEEEPSE